MGWARSPREEERIASRPGRLLLRSQRLSRSGSVRAELIVAVGVALEVVLVFGPGLPDVNPLLEASPGGGRPRGRLGAARRHRPLRRPGRRTVPARRPACGHRLPHARRPALSLTGRCPACHQHTGPPPLAAGVITAVLLGALAARVHPRLVLAAAGWLALCAVPLGFIDAAVRRLPDPLTAAA